jgi:hypothetical protein
VAAPLAPPPRYFLTQSLEPLWVGPGLVEVIPLSVSLSKNVFVMAGAGPVWEEPGGCPRDLPAASILIGVSTGLAGGYCAMRFSMRATQLSRLSRS